MFRYTLPDNWVDNSYVNQGGEIGKHLCCQITWDTIEKLCNRKIKWEWFLSPYLNNKKNESYGRYYYWQEMYADKPGSSKFRNTFRMGIMQSKEPFTPELIKELNLVDLTQLIMEWSK